MRPSGLEVARDARCLRASIGPHPKSSLKQSPRSATIPAADWDACANPARLPDIRRRFKSRPYNPFVSHAFSRRARGLRLGHGAHRLAAAASGRRGCDGAVVGVVPCYLKSHSQGEYVFDRGWADAYERAGGALLSEAAGRRCRSRRRPAAACWSAPGRPRARCAKRSPRGLMGCADATEASSVHVTFAREAECEAARRARLPAPQRPAVPLAQRRLRDLRRFSRRAEFGRKRKAIKRERREALAHRHHHALAHRQRIDRRGVGRVLRLLHGDRLAQMGPALSDAQLLLADRRDAWPTTCCW